MGTIIRLMRSVTRKGRRMNKAESYGIFFYKRAFWPPFHITYGEPVIAGTSAVVLNDIYRAKTGEAVDLIRDGDIVHKYRLLSKFNSPGSDHFVSPLKFELLYVGSHIERSEAA